MLALSQKGFSEVAAVGRARGVDLPANIEARALQFTRNAPPELMPSMAIDLLRGNRLEFTVARRQSGGARPRIGRADTYARRHVRGAETVRQWRTSLSRSSHSSD